MKVRNKGKVHPFVSSSSSPSRTANKDDFPVLNLLPAAIFALVSLLSLDDREVLAYMITRSLNSANNPPSFHDEDKKRNSKKLTTGADLHGLKSAALFDCECFYCYTSFWFRWDSSPDRELIHRAIEEFEEHLSNGEVSIGCGNGRNKRKEKMGRRKSEKICPGGGVLEIPGAVLLTENQECTPVIDPPASKAGTEADDAGGWVYDAEMGDVAAAPAVAVHNHKGLARKVLPDVMGIFRSRLWSLWSPNV